MVDQKLLDYIQKSREAGRSDDQIRDLLCKNGWTEAEVNNVFFNMSQPQPQQQPQPQPQYQTQPESQSQPESEPDFQSQYQTQPQPIQENISVKKRGRPLLLLFIVLIILAIAGVVGFFFKDKIINQISNFSSIFFSPSPESVILKAWNNLSVIKSESFNSDFSLSGKNIKANGGGGNFDVNLKFSGGVDNSDVVKKLANIQVSLIVSATNINNLETESETYNLSVSSEARLIQKDIYLKLNDINLGGLENFIMMFGGPDPSEIKEKWIRFQMDSLAQEEIAQKIKAVSGQQINADQDYKDAMNKIVKILLDKKVYNISRLQDNQLSVGKEYHYYISLNREKIIEVSPEIFSVLQDYYTKINPVDPLLPEFNLESFQKIINDFFNKVGETGADLFIGKKDNFFHKIKFTKDLDVSKFGDKYSGIIKINYEIDHADINKPIQVSVPEKYVDFKSFISSFVLKENMDRISFIAQRIYSTNKSYYLLCAKGLLNGYQKSYGKELINLNATMVDNGATKPVCFAGVKDYCISTQLSDGSWMCVDKSGNIGKTKCVFYKTVCK
ncbi:MAG: hypothetical protein Q8O66_01075 [bacterium]|nr:hypothetical protein [bacterium]